MGSPNIGDSSIAVSLMPHILAWITNGPLYLSYLSTAPAKKPTVVLNGDLNQSAVK